MSRADLFLLLSAIYIAPCLPTVIGLIMGTLFILAAILFTFWEEK